MTRIYPDSAMLKKKQCWFSLWIIRRLSTFPPTVQYVLEKLYIMDQLFCIQSVAWWETYPVPNQLPWIFVYLMVTCRTRPWRRYVLPFAFKASDTCSRLPTPAAENNSRIVNLSAPFFILKSIKGRDERSPIRPSQAHLGPVVQRPDSAIHLIVTFWSVLNCPLIGITQIKLQYLWNIVSAHWMSVVSQLFKHF